MTNPLRPTLATRAPQSPADRQRATSAAYRMILALLDAGEWQNAVAAFSAAVESGTLRGSDKTALSIHLGLE